MRPSSVVILLLLLVLTTTSCISVQTKQELGVPQYVPTDPGMVQILRSPPERPNIRLGEITVEPQTDNPSTQKLEQAFQKAAAKMGAHAVVIVADRTQVMGMQATGPWYGRELSADLERVIVGVAIRYTDRQALSQP